MTEPIAFDTLAMIATAQFAVAVVAVLIGYKLLETNWWLGFVGSVGLGVGIVGAEWYVGDRVWDPGFHAPELVAAVLAAAGGAAAGIMLVVAFVEPETDDGGGAVGSRASGNESAVDVPGGLGEGGESR